MSKNLPIAVKRRPFKIWVKNQRRLVDFTFSYKYIPSRLIPSNLLGFNSSVSSSLRFRRVVVKSSSYGYISANAIEAFRKVIAPHFRKKKSKIYKFLIRCYPYMPLTKKPAEVRMGGGKGSKVRGFYSPVRPGQILFEVFVREPQITKKLFIYAARKLPVPVTVITILFLICWLLLTIILRSGFLIILEFLRFVQLTFTKRERQKFVTYLSAVFHA